MSEETMKNRSTFSKPILQQVTKGVFVHLKTLKMLAERKRTSQSG